jgi:hypothetical protein
MSSKKLAKMSRRQGNSPQAIYMAAWLKRFAQTYGDQLPFAEWFGSTEIRLPFETKQLVYQHYCADLNKDPTEFRMVMTYNKFVSSWKSRADLKHIKCAKFKPGFAKCDKCDQFDLAMRKQLDPIQKDQLQLELAKHI